MTEREFIKAVSRAIHSRNAEESAHAVYRICCEAAKAWGMKPEIEVAIRAPGEARHHGDTSCWSVCFEAGPYQWAIAASMNTPSGCNVLAEPYYSFDLCFSDM